MLGNEKLITVLTLGLLFSCSPTANQNGGNEAEVVRDTVRIVDTVFVERQHDSETSEYYIRERLPDWFLKTNVLDGIKIKGKYKFDSRLKHFYLYSELNPLYLEEDFNGDGHLDLAIPIREIDTEKMGFAIIHGKTNQVFIIGAGVPIKNGLSDDMDYVDIWKINRERKHGTVLDENYKEEYIIISVPALEIKQSETGGGIIYWNGKEYVYLHQTC